MTMGAGGNIKSALWAELFGTEMIGTVRSLFSSVMVFSTALSPFLFGWLLDIETHIYYIFVAGVITTLISALLALRIHPGLRRSEERRVAKSRGVRQRGRRCR